MWNFARVFLMASLLGWVVTCVLMTSQPPMDALYKEVHAAPVQKFHPQTNREFTYKGQKIKLIEMADYEIAGIVVSHNDPGAWYRMDMTHDARSVETRNICLMWGANMLKNIYRDTPVHNDDTACVFGSPSVEDINPDDIANHRLLTDNDALRQRIANIHTGDQIIFKGSLVSYGEERWGGHNTVNVVSHGSNDIARSVTLLVTDLTILYSPNERWAVTNQIFLFLSFTAAVLCLGMRFLNANY